MGQLFQFLLFPSGVTAIRESKYTATTWHYLFHLVYRHYSLLCLSFGQILDILKHVSFSKRGTFRPLDFINKATI